MKSALGSIRVPSETKKSATKASRKGHKLSMRIVQVRQTTDG
jgi:hypothetical protein